MYAAYLKARRGSKSFEGPFYDCQVVSLEKGTPGQFLGEFVIRMDEVGDYFDNGMGTVHGGAIATFVDNLTCGAVGVLDLKHRWNSVSVSIAVDYLNAAKIGSGLIFRARVNKIGKTLAFATCDVEDLNGKVLMKSSHTMAF